jgi:hypothetical protein
MFAALAAMKGDGPDKHVVGPDFCVMVIGMASVFSCP